LIVRIEQSFSTQALTKVPSEYHLERARSRRTPHPAEELSTDATQPVPVWGYTQRQADTIQFTTKIVLFGKQPAVFRVLKKRIMYVIMFILLTIDTQLSIEYHHPEIA